MDKIYDQPAIDEAWKLGFEAGRQSVLSNQVDAADDENDESTSILIGDIVQLTDGLFYIVCKISEGTLVLVDVYNHRLISTDSASIVSAGRFDPGDESLNNMLDNKWFREDF